MKPESIEQSAEEAQEEATTGRINRLSEAMKQIEQRASNHQLIPTITQLLVDPEDNVQTIENFFDLSFLVQVSHLIFLFLIMKLMYFSKAKRGKDRSR